MPPAYSEAIYRMVTKWVPETRIEFQQDAKRPGSKSSERYQAYQGAKCIGEALALGAWPEDLVHDYSKKYLKMHKDQRIKLPNASSLYSSKEKAKLEKFLKHMRGPAGCNMRKIQAKKLKAVERLKKLGIDFRDMRQEKNCQESNDLQALRLAADCAANEILQEVDATGRKVSEKDITTVLDLWAFRKNEARQNVLPEGKTWVNSDTLGLIRDRKGSFIITSPTKDYPHFMFLLNRYLKDRRPKEFSHDFPYTTISLNFGYNAKRHRDSGNLGPSMIKGFGKYKGGLLSYWPDDDKTIGLDDLRDEDKVSLDISQGLVLFDGNRAHEVDAFHGERFSMVWFSVDKYWKASPDVLDALRERGYAVPTEATTAMARTLLPAPQGYTHCQSLTSMFGIREKPKVYQWMENCDTEGSKDASKNADLKALFGAPSSTPSQASAAGSTPSAPSQSGESEPGAKDHTSEAHQEPHKPVKSVDLKALLFGKPGGEGTQTPDAAKTDSPKREETSATPDASMDGAKKEESSTPCATPVRKGEERVGCKRAASDSTQKTKKSKKANVEGSTKDGPKDTPMPASVSQEETPSMKVLASEDFAPEKVEGGWCSRLGFIALALKAAEAKPEAPAVVLTNCFRSILHSSEEPLADLAHSMEILLQSKMEPLPKEVLEALEQGLDQEAAHAPLTLAQARASWRAAQGAGDEARVHVGRLLRAAGGTAEATALARLLRGEQSALPPAMVLRALAHAFALTRPPRGDEPATARAFSSAESRSTRLLATEKAIALAYSETGGHLDRLLSELLNDRRPAELYGCCGPRCGRVVLPMKPVEERDAEVLLNEVTGSAVLVEELFQGDLVQVHKSSDGISILAARKDASVVSLNEEVLAAVQQAVHAKDCILEAVLQRGKQHCLQVIDCLYLDGKCLTRRNLRERREALLKAFKPSDTVQQPPCEEFALEEPLSAEVLSSLLEEASASGSRGVMVKRLDREYEAGTTSTSCTALLC